MTAATAPTRTNSHVGLQSRVVSGGRDHVGGAVSSTGVVSIDFGPAVTFHLPSSSATNATIVLLPSAASVRSGL